jgi:hypothetical protein
MDGWMIGQMDEMMFHFMTSMAPLAFLKVKYTCITGRGS